MAERYAHPEVLVETPWLNDHLEDRGLRVAEVSEDVTLYDQGHIPGAVHFNWKTDLQDAVRRDWVNREQFEALLGGHGIGTDTTVILYGDKNNWFATYTFWLFKIYGVEAVRILNGGRGKWIAEGRPMTASVPDAGPPAMSQRPRARHRPWSGRSGVGRRMLATRGEGVNSRDRRRC